MNSTVYPIFMNKVFIEDSYKNSTIVGYVEDSKPASFGVRIYYIYSHDKGKQ
jgi:hypothetical protein